jgi:membrane fusion protein, multidrug efflux system
MTLRKRRHTFLLVQALVTVTMLTACRSDTAEEVESETVVSVKTAAATRGDIQAVIHATGVVTPAPGAELVVVAPEAARIVELPRATGDRVRRGDLLVRFEIPTAAAEVQRQRAEVGRALASLENAKAAQARATALFERGVAARREVEDSNRAMADADAALTQARASLAASEALASRAIVHATFDGVIARRLHNPGDLVEPTVSDPVLRVVDPRRLEVVASVPVTDATRVEVGASARLVGVETHGSVADLKVASGPAEVEPGTAAVPVRLGFVGPADLPTGTPVQVDIGAELHRNVVLVPAAAVVREGEETFVFVADNAKAQRRAVQIGIADETHVEVVSGVKAGETVIVEGQVGLPDDAAITTDREEDAAGAPEPGGAALKDEAK